MSPNFSEMPSALQSFLLDSVADRIGKYLDWFEDCSEDSPDLAAFYSYEFFLAINLYREWYAEYSDDGQIDLWQECCRPDQLELYPKFYEIGSKFEGVRE